MRVEILPHVAAGQRIVDRRPNKQRRHRHDRVAHTGGGRIGARFCKFGRRSLWRESARTRRGEVSGEVKLVSPPVWDGMAVAQGRLYVASVDGKVRCFGKK